MRGCLLCHFHDRSGEDVVYKVLGTLFLLGMAAGTEEGRVNLLQTLLLGKKKVRSW